MVKFLILSNYLTLNLGPDVDTLKTVKICKYVFKND